MISDNYPSEITKEELERMLLEWSDGTISNAELHEWAETIYFPPTQKIGLAWPVHTQYAMGIILSQLDFKPPNQGTALFAIEFLEATIDDFGDRLRKFVDNCFGPIDEGEFSQAMERVERWKSAN